MAVNFGCVVPGRFPITGDAFRQVSANQWMAPIGYACDAFSVFLISPAANDSLPGDSGLACYLCRCESQVSWTYIGHLTNGRPSALLRAPPHFLELHRGVEVFLGISVQPLREIANFGGEHELAMQAQCRVARLDDIARRMSEDFFNFVGSYCRSERRLQPELRWFATRSIAAKGRRSRPDSSGRSSAMPRVS